MFFLLQIFAAQPDVGRDRDRLREERGGANDNDTRGRNPPLGERDAEVLATWYGYGRKIRNNPVDWHSGQIEELNVARSFRVVVSKDGVQDACGCLHDETCHDACRIVEAYRPQYP